MLEVTTEPSSDIDRLMDLRGMCRWLKKWKAADRVKKRIEAAGAVVFDGPDGKSWWRWAAEWDRELKRRSAEKAFDGWLKAKTQES